MNKMVKAVALIGSGALAAGILYLGVSLLLPPVLPTSVAASESTAAARNTRVAKKSRENPAQSTSQPKPGPNGLVKIQYNPVAKNNALALARTLHMTLLLPTHAYPKVALNESYASHGMLNLEFNDMVVIESKNPITPSYKPASSLGVTLSNGIPAQWLLLYGVGAGGYRLQFQQDGTYVRLQLFGAYIPAGLKNAEQIAAQFSAVS
ncbi:MAG: hypothetical protein M1294_10780 [Firmicutes bacterium]|uniref:DUF4367 domain-containing protein n=1 Tax=Sulfobacillus benefaciens TaxID=453960 RepID=A0A2T2WPR0_9FIRM|nr:hypothetical protein [Bacillota bacterium]MCL5014688.1 hypothetical protein [Bacillota bacterium]PSR24228.1 MAG: hypothetical protein C7B43_19520 [Sulfobacillus benefaciens]